MQRAGDILWISVDVTLGWPILSYWSEDPRLTVATGQDEDGRRRLVGPENEKSWSVPPVLSNPCHIAAIAWCPPGFQLQVFVRRCSTDTLVGCPQAAEPSFWLIFSYLFVGYGLGNKSRRQKRTRKHLFGYHFTHSMGRRRVRVTWLSMITRWQSWSNFSRKGKGTNKIINLL